ncbi:Uncharacterised protein [Bordetella pertussis]|nr:Uncharacterised protein [Bordetella pertussis]
MGFVGSTTNGVLQRIVRLFASTAAISTSGWCARRC